MIARAALAAALLAGCAVPSGATPVTRVEIDAVPTLVDQCDDALTKWTVRVRETGEQSTAACDQAIVVSELEPYVHYTLEISGYSRRTLCWSGRCEISPLPGLAIAECPHAATDLCADAGE